MLSTTEVIVGASTISKKTRRLLPRAPPNQREPSIWMFLAILQALVWLVGIPVLCRKYVWDDLFGPLIALHPTFGVEIAVFVFTISIAPVFFVLYTMVMIPIYAGRYPFFEQYKIQHQVCWPWFDPNPKVKEAFWKLSRRSLKLCAFNMFILVPILVGGKIYVEREMFGKDMSFFFDTDDDHWPSMEKNIMDILLMVVIHEFGFYVTHKMMHEYPFLYKYHKVHHEYKINTTLASQHNHPIDYIISIGVPAVLSIALVPSSHSISQFQYILWLLWANLDDHVGYAFPWSPVRWFPGSATTDEHEFHHSKNVGCYASKLSCFNSIFGGYEHYNRYYSRRRGVTSKRQQ